MRADTPPIAPAVIRFEQDTPVSERFDDSYFMRGQGPDESEAVFIRASQLPQRFAAMGPDALFVIGETGFGSGLNCLLAARCFQTHAPARARLHLVSAELHPLQRADLQRILSRWSGFENLASRLLRDYPPPCPGYHRISLADNIDLTLMLGDATECWDNARIDVDAWFLDGFAPSKNRQMWHSKLFEALARRSRAGASVATFTAAGVVRRRLEQAGFEVRRMPGFAGKRHRTVARWPGEAVARFVRRGRALVAGAGLAGATTARALAERGWQVIVCDPAGIAAGASGNLAGVIYATPSAHLTPQNRFYQSAFVQACRWLHHLNFPAVRDDGRLDAVVQTSVDERHYERLHQALASGAWPPELMTQSGQRVFQLEGAGYIRPDRWCRHLLDHQAITVRQHAVASFTPGTPVTVALDHGQVLSTDLLVLCVAEAAHSLQGLEWLPLKRIRGQVSYCAATEQSRRWTRAVCHAGYLTPALGGLHCVGATFDLHRDRPVIDPADDHANLEQLRQYLPEHWHALGGESIAVVQSRAAVRCQSTDFLPLVGTMPDPSTIPHQDLTGVCLNLAHGARGITHTPLCADLLADQACGLPAPAEPAVEDALAPERFILRQRRRHPGWIPSRAGKK